MAGVLLEADLVHLEKFVGVLGAKIGETIGGSGRVVAFHVSEYYIAFVARIAAVGRGVERGKMFFPYMGGEVAVDGFAADVTLVAADGGGFDFFGRALSPYALEMRYRGVRSRKAAVLKFLYLFRVVSLPRYDVRIRVRLLGMTDRVVPVVAVLVVAVSAREHICHRQVLPQNVFSPLEHSHHLNFVRC